MKVSIITATVGKSELERCVSSVRNQTYDNIEHIVVVDGQERWGATQDILYNLGFPIGGERGSLSNEYVCVLPYPTGTNRFNGHRIYGSFIHLVNGDFIIWLDDDNTLEPNHVESLVKLAKKDDLHWAYSFRKIVDENYNFICNDDCESLGKWKSVLNDNFVDVNCFFVRKDLALQISPIWYRQIRQPGVMEVDRALSAVLMNSQNNLKFDTTYEYSVNYRVGSTEFSVRKEFFIEGNKKMNEVYGNNLPWKK